MKSLQQKKGAAIEMAIVFMLVTFALCSMLVTVAFASTARNNYAYREANDRYVIDQIGEYFLRGLEGNSTIDFMQDVPDGHESDPAYVRGGWVRLNGEDSSGYGVNISGSGSIDSPGIFTLRIADWEFVSTDGIVKDQSAIKLIVTVKKEVSGCTILNWSNQPIAGDSDSKIMDAPSSQNTDYTEEYIAMVEKGVKIILFIGGVISRFLTGR